MKWTGAAVKRVEDPRYITGSASYLDDLLLPRMCHAKFLRSPYARARIIRIDARGAKEIPGVLAVLTGADLKKMVNPIKPFGAVRLPIKLFSLATDYVHFVGEPVVAVVADDRYIAEDALDKIVVEYEPLEPVLDPEKALREDSPLVYEGVGSNVAFHNTFVWGDVDGAFKESDLVVDTEIRLQRYSSTTMEKNGCVADYNVYTGHLTTWNVDHVTGRLMEEISEVMGVPTHKITMNMPDVGGSYGNRNNKHNVITVSILSKLTGRPVKWVDTEREAFNSSGHACNGIFKVKAAVKRDGTVLALKIFDIEDEGGYPTLATLQLLNKTSGIVGCYKIKAVSFEGYSVLTNKCPSIPNRGIGKPGINYIIERTMDKIAKTLGMDRAEIRSANFIQPDEFPYTTPNGRVYDSGNFPELLSKAKKLVGYEDLEPEKIKLREQGRYVGFGVVSSVQYSVQLTPGFVPSEATTIKIDPAGKVQVLHGSGSTGQGHETALAQVIADELGVNMDDIDIEPGWNSSTHPYTEFSGVYTNKFHCTDIGSAVQAARGIRGIAGKIAAYLLDTDEKDIVFRDGKIFASAHPSKELTLADIAAEAYRRPQTLTKLGIDSGLTITSTYVLKIAKPDLSSHYTFSSSVHIPVVEVDIGTGEVKILKYAVVEDCGTIINPLIAEGQLQGSTLHGISAALREEFIYDDNGQLLTSTYMDYLKPTIKEAPELLIDHVVTPSPFTPLGAKGVGESGAIPAPAALASAIEDALLPFGITVSELPMRPQKIMEKLWESEEGGVGVLTSSVAEKLS